MSEDQANTAAQTVATGDVVVADKFLVIDGCKVARVEPGGVLAFRDRCRRRQTSRGSDQVRVRVADLTRAVEEVQAPEPEN